MRKFMLPETGMTSYKVVVKAVCVNENWNGSIMFSYFLQNRVLFKSEKQFSNCGNKHVLGARHVRECTYQTLLKKIGYIFLHAAII
jgi:hypothetical protein